MVFINLEDQANISTSNKVLELSNHKRGRISGNNHPYIKVTGCLFLGLSVCTEESPLNRYGIHRSWKGI